MNKFPYFNHFVGKIIFNKDFVFRKEKVEALLEELVEELKLHVVKESEFLFTNDGLTKIYVLSQSHLVAHTWPEDRAMHIDLMTCSEGLNGEKFRKALNKELVEAVEIKELKY